MLPVPAVVHYPLIRIGSIAKAGRSGYEGASSAIDIYVARIL